MTIRWKDYWPLFQFLGSLAWFFMRSFALPIVLAIFVIVSIIITLVV